MLENIICPGSPPVEYNDQLKDIAAVGPGSNGIAAQAAVGLFMNGKIEGNKLSGCKIEGG
jgi:hypothetical protein